MPSARLAKTQTTKFEISRANALIIENISQIKKKDIWHNQKSLSL